MIIPFFLRNRGCPHRCRFCNQEISGGADPRKLGAGYFHEKVRAFLTSAARGKKPGQPVEIAFYGGNFTGLTPEEQEDLLHMARRHMENGTVVGIRVSTRPDCLRDKDVERLAAFGVRTVEIGAQSLVDGVLAASGRGHTARDVVAAVAMLKHRGLEVILHLMAGLPGDDAGKFAATLTRTAALEPRAVRLHPTLVFTGTALAAAYLQGHYTPLTLPEAVEICREACDFLEGKGIGVIRLGLQDTALMGKPGMVLGGPYHPAFGALVAAARWRKRAFALLAGADIRGRNVVFSIPAGKESVFRGNRNSNIQALQTHFRFASLRIVAGGDNFGCRIC